MTAVMRFGESASFNSLGQESFWSSVPKCRASGIDLGSTIARIIGRKALGNGANRSVSGLNPRFSAIVDGLVT
ncbi:hypothetical protein PWG15_17880 [Ensifer adhaerens]|uniref:hypothetical protein n=1 Tax=Ensifer adhaerens TaxID=106592 RepID=UPI0023A92D40|nr:hypothetical protein [Ensifer adhaerens]WDZ76440.1 hypothetical protein PWG15_17880 [Ensifer adhaerens]